MALIKCSKCGKEISSLAERCPYCKAKVSVAANDEGDRFILGGNNSPADMNSSSIPAKETGDVCAKQHKSCNFMKSLLQDSKMRWIACGVAIVAVLGIILLGIWIKDEYDSLKHKEEMLAKAPRYYAIAETIFWSNNEIPLDTIPYGAEMIENPFEFGGSRQSVYYGDTQGYVDRTDVLSAGDFEFFKGIFGNEEALEAVQSAKYRRALFDFYKRGNMVSKLSDKDKREIYDNAPPPQWQFILRHGAGTPSEILFKRIDNPDARYADMAVILEDIESHRRKTVAFRSTDNGKTSVLFVYDAPATGDIVDVTKAPHSSYKVIYTSDKPEVSPETEPFPEAKPARRPENEVKERFKRL